MRPRTYNGRVLRIQTIFLLMFSSLAATYLAGCRHTRSPKRLRLPAGDCQPCTDLWQQFESPRLCDETATDATALYTGPPITISNFSEVTYVELTLEECVHEALRNSKILNKIGGQVVSAPGAVSTLMDQAIIETDPRGSVEAALSAFDAQVNGRVGMAHTERTFNNSFQGAFSGNTTNSGDFRAELSKTTAAGTQLSIRNVTNYTRFDSIANTFRSVWDTVNQIDIRQPLLRNSGVAINRIAGPNATVGNYNGVLLARVRSDISLADFKAAVRNLIRDVETNYWELYFAYRDLDTKLDARDATRKTWQNRKLRFDEGEGRADEEAQARQQYFSFKAQAENALVGRGQGQLGVLGSERNLRRLMGLPVGEGQLIKPKSDPAVAPTIFDWQSSQAATINQRPEILRQKWVIKQRELELTAAKALNTWRLDLVGQYGFRGFGDNLFGSRGRQNGSAFDDLLEGNLDDWNFGFELDGPLGNRQGHLAVRNAELRLIREKAVLREQQRQLLHDLSSAYAEVDRALANMRTLYNSRFAIQEELEPKRLRSEEGRDQIFFLLDVQQRAATAESQLVRAIVDYNQALLSYSFTTGSLLSRFNVVLQEDQWISEAQQNALQKAVRYRSLYRNATTDIAPISDGTPLSGEIPTTVGPQFPSEPDHGLAPSN